MPGLVGWILARRNFVYSFSVCTSAPSMLLCLLQVYVIVRQSQFHNLFFLLFSIRGIAEIFLTLNSYYANRLPTLFGAFLLPFYSNLPNWVLNLFWVSTTLFSQMDNLCTSFMFLNRLTAVLIPTKHKQFWRKFRVLFLLIVFVIPICTSLPLFLGETALQVETDAATNRTVSFLFLPKGDQKWANYSNGLKAISSVLFLAVCFLINSVIFVQFRKKSQLAGSSNQSQMSSVQHKLMVYTVVTLAGHVLTAIFLIFVFAMQLFETTQAQVNILAYELYPLVNDSCTLILSSWTILWASEPFRRAFIEELLPNRVGNYLYGAGGGGTTMPATATKVKPSSTHGSAMVAWND